MGRVFRCRKRFACVDEVFRIFMDVRSQTSNSSAAVLACRRGASVRPHRRKARRSIGPAANVGPYLIDLLFADLAAPGRHLAASLQDRLVEPGSLVRIELPQIGDRSGASQFLSMTRRAMLFVDGLAGLDGSLIL